MEDMLNILTRRSFAASRIRNGIAVLAIALTAVLFTAITTIVLGTMESFTLTMQMQKMSRSDGELRFMTAEQFEALRQTDFIETAGLRMPVAYLSNAVRHNIEFNVEDEIQAGLTFCTPTHGRPPAAPNEAAASDLALRVQKPGALFQRCQWSNAPSKKITISLITYKGNVGYIKLFPLIRSVGKRQHVPFIPYTLFQA